MLALFVLSVIILFMSTGCQTLSHSLIGDDAFYYVPGGVEGIARFYAKRYEGRRTTSGENISRKKTDGRPIRLCRWEPGSEW